MQQAKEISLTLSDSLINKVEYFPTQMLLNLHTKSCEDCGGLWSELFGQVNDNAEGRSPILYNMPEDPPELWPTSDTTKLWVMNIEIDQEGLFQLLNYIETELEGFLPSGTCQNFKQRMNLVEKSPSPSLSIHVKNGKESSEGANQAEPQNLTSANNGKIYK